MTESTEIINTSSQNDIRHKIYTIRGVQVMLDSDLAELYQIETRVLNQAVKRNVNRFPIRFCFQLTKIEFEDLKSQNVISSGISNWGGIRKMPYAFTEHGVTMLSSVLRSEIAVSMGIKIVDEFISMRHYLMDNALVFQRLDRIETKQIENKIEADKNFEKIFKQLENPKEVKAVLFFKGQMWDVTSLIEDIIIKAKEEIILIDNYIDKKTLDLLVKKKKGVAVNIYTSEKGNKLTEKEITDFNNQYGLLNIRYTDEFHDRFMILDKKVLYHIGSSIKDDGKKAFEISIIEDKKQLKEILRRLKVN